MAGVPQRTTLTGIGFYPTRTPQPTSRPPGDKIARQVAAADSAALEHARVRLTRRLPARALAGADQYFAVPGVDVWEGPTRPEPGADVPALGSGRPDADLEVPQFDRQRPGWAPFADDVAAVTGADVVLELLVADPSRGHAGAWRRDGSDVLITVIDGAERLSVASTEPPDAEPEPELDAVLRPGDTLRVPRAMLHTARPEAGAGSTLLSIRLRRATDWSLGRSAPSHLGFEDYPRSKAEYRLCLRAHVPPTPPPPTGWDPEASVLRTRLPGGLAVLDVRGAEVTFVAAGAVYTGSKSVLRVLAGIHAADGIAMADIALATGVSSRTARSVVDTLLSRGLVRLDRLDHLDRLDRLAQP